MFKGDTSQYILVLNKCLFYLVIFRTTHEKEDLKIKSYVRMAISCTCYVFESRSSIEAQISLFFILDRVTFDKFAKDIKK